MWQDRYRIPDPPAGMADTHQDTTESYPETPDQQAGVISSYPDASGICKRKIEKKEQRQERGQMK